MGSIRIVGTGSYVPEKILTNDDLEIALETSDEWIVQRTGIKERRIANPDQATLVLAVRHDRGGRALHILGIQPHIQKQLPSHLVVHRSIRMETESLNTHVGKLLHNLLQTPSPPPGHVGVG